MKYSVLKGIFNDVRTSVNIILFQIQQFSHSLLRQNKIRKNVYYRFAKNEWNEFQHENPYQFVKNS